MKKILRTKLEYNCNKTQEFNYGLCDWYTKYDRSFDMYVSASTKEECEKAMESFEDAIRAEGIQDFFDSNLAPEFDEKKELWVGAVEVYVGNDFVAEEKEAIKEVYNEWKKLLKTNPVTVETPATVETTEAMEVVEAPVSEKENRGYISQEDRVEQKISTLKSMGSTYSVDDGAGTKMMLGFNDGEMWFGVDYCWNRFSSLKLDYQEYILDLVIKGCYGN